MVKWFINMFTSQRCDFGWLVQFGLFGFSVILEYKMVSRLKINQNTCRFGIDVYLVVGTVQVELYYHHFAHHIDLVYIHRLDMDT